MGDYLTISFDISKSEAVPPWQNQWKLNYFSKILFELIPQDIRSCIRIGKRKGTFHFVQAKRTK